MTFNGKINGKRCKHITNGKNINVDDLIELYKPTKILVENQDDIAMKGLINLKNINKLRVEHNKIPSNYMFQFYTIYKCNELSKEHEKEVNIKYDIIIRCRFDIFINA
jgi:hypothetical protein